MNFKSENKKEKKARLVEARHNFYLSFFDDSRKYEEKNINGFWLVKQWNPEREQSQVSLYTEEAFRLFKERLVSGSKK